MSRPNFLYGGLVGLLLIVPLIVVSALGNQFSGLPFVPYDLFPFVRDLTPGPVLTFVIDTMVGTIISLNLGRVDTAAKVAEQAMAILMLVGLGVVVGAIFFAAVRSPRNAITGGLAVGLILGIVLAVISNDLGLSAITGIPLLNALWIILLFVLWGWMLGRAYERLSAPETSAQAQAA